MADTKRSFAETIALAATNTVGAISAQDLRDIIVSLLPTYASFLVNAPAATVVGVQSQWYKAAGGTVPLQTDADFDFPVDNRIRYVGPNTRQILLWGSGNIESAVNNQELAIGIAKNGVIIPASEISRFVDNQNRGAFALNISVPADSGDYFEVWLKNDTSAANITLDQFNLGALAILR